MLYHIGKFFFTVIAKVFYRHKVYGERIFPEGGGLVASNHSSFLDPPFVGLSCPVDVEFLARATLFNNRFFGYLIKKTHAHPVKAGRENVSAIKKVIELIEDGKKVLIFPEGTRTHEGALQKGQIGVGMIVMRTRCFVIPTYIHGTYEIWNRNRKFPKIFGKTACVIGKPLYFNFDENEDRKVLQQKIADDIMKAISELQKWYVSRKD